MSNILVSACLLGICCKYNGGCNKNERVIKLTEEHTLIPVCPEQLGGLSTPRCPSERCGDKVINKLGEDVTEFYKKGAEETLKLARIFNCEKAVLKEKSPSCGMGYIYDGAFSGTLTEGMGVTAELLKESGIEVIGENGDFFG